MKKLLCLILCVLFVFSFASCSSENADIKKIINSNITADFSNSQNITVNFRTTSDYFYHSENDKWNKKMLVGLNMGLTLATTDLNNANISYATFYDWFSKIQAMNANTVKVFTIMNPDFYKALYDYNKAHSKSPVYLLQGIWFNESYLYDIGDAYDSENIVVNSFKKSCKETVDIIHGNSSYTVYGEYNPAVYNCDVSDYLAGYILGLEWPSDFVINTNSHKDKSTYSGKYLYTTDKASAFESFLCSIGDYIIDYDTSSYSFQCPVAFLNWSTTDPLTHTNEPFDEEDAVSVDTENIKSTDSYYSGMFAALDLYPYYPEFLNYQSEYVNYTDSNSNKNPYEAYLMDLKKHYSVPIIAAEFGVPTSRGIAHKSTIGYNQGGINEEQQGQYVCDMLGSIIKSNFAGGMVFSWQDEWFKQTWNTIKYSPENPAERTPNVQSAEQSYGLLAVEPSSKTICVIDGKENDWSRDNLVQEGSDMSLYAKYDEAYLYIKINLKKGDFSNTKVYVPISTVGQGSSFASDYNLNFSSPVDWLLVINSKDDTRLLTDAYNNSFSFIYGKQKQVVDYNVANSRQNSGKYHKINTFISNEMYLPVDDKTISPQYYESGKMTFGTTDTLAESYNSLADFCYSSSVAEFRIPWYLLGVLNSSNATCVNDFNKDGELSTSTFNDVLIGGGIGSDINLDSINYHPTKSSTFHTRLKQSYSIISDYLKSIF